MTANCHKEFNIGDIKYISISLTHLQLFDQRFNQDICRNRRESAIGIDAISKNNGPQLDVCMVFYYRKCHFLVNSGSNRVSVLCQVVKEPKKTVQSD